MAFDDILALRIRKALKKLTPFEEKKMMGGLTFMVNEKMCVGILKDELMCRIHPEKHDEALKKSGCRTMDFTKKPMKGFVLVNSDGTSNESDLEFWLKMSLEYNPIAPQSKSKKKKDKKP
jgi:TfoX/Sxy family transcriptional regulator of competence genes